MKNVISIRSLTLLVVGVVMTGEVTGDAYQVPRLANGQPDFQGVWTNSSLTQLTRGRQFKSLILSKEDAARIEAGRAASTERALKPTDPNAPAPSKGGVGGYNNFWLDPGSSFGQIDGEYRTSWLIDPEDGQLPYSEKGRKIFNEQAAAYRNHVDNPEGRPMAERCIIGFGSTGGPPMLNVLYNNHYQFVQSDKAVMIQVEMNHDARIVRLNEQHLPKSMTPWLGDSIGQWEGDTLVVETTNFHPGEQLRLNFNQSFYLSTNAKVVEKFTRSAEDTLFYEFAVTDPDIYTQTWRAEMVFRRAEDNIYEYACHEGNYALPGILAGARKEESDAAKK
ncbi:MAG: hypothetical protein ACRBCS_14570 [Cellvibrionaceae bacterium]